MFSMVSEMSLIVCPSVRPSIPSFVSFPIFKNNHRFCSCHSFGRCYCCSYCCRSFFYIFYMIANLCGFWSFVLFLLLIQLLTIYLLLIRSLWLLVVLVVAWMTAWRFHSIQFLCSISSCYTCISICICTLDPPTSLPSSLRPPLSHSLSMMCIIFILISMADNNDNDE